MDSVVLNGNFVRLEPLAETHEAGLCAAISDGELWKLHVTFVPHPETIGRFFSAAARVRDEGTGLVFATLDKASGRVIGSTRFMHFHEANKRVEIGFTFLARSYQRTAANTEAKLLMLTHAFESLDLNRVEFLTDYLNRSSRQAILRLGAKQEGILRNHMLMPDGRIRDSVIYSLISSEWPGIRSHLEAMLA